MKQAQKPNRQIQQKEVQRNEKRPAQPETIQPKKLQELNLVDFLRYVERSDGSGIAEDCDEKLKYLHEKVKRIKASRQVEVSYVRTQERERLIREEGQNRKLLELIGKKLRRGDSQEKIAEDLCEELMLVQRFSVALRKCEPAYDPDAALALLESLQG